MEVFSLTGPEALEAEFAKIKNAPPYVFLKKPASGMIMVRGRVSGSGRLANIGEMLISRCVVDLQGFTGCGYTPFESLRHCELAAVLDALAQHPDFAEECLRLEEGLRARLREKEAAELEEAEGTRVEFFTVRRGEDE
jgi:alpha-D-ribose 1-methylphosphonate 5-triphosphate synthase subunit PhnG